MTFFPGEMTGGISEESCPREKCPDSHVRMQASTYSDYDLCHTLTDTETAFDQLYY